MADPGYSGPSERRNPQTGQMEILVFTPTAHFWVPAQWNLITGHLEPIDKKYRNDSPALFSVRQYRNSFAGDGSTNSFDFGGPLDLSVPGSSIVPGSASEAPFLSLQTPSAQNNSGVVWLAVAAVVVLFLWSR